MAWVWEDGLPCSGVRFEECADWELTVSCVVSRWAVSEWVVSSWAVS